MTVWVVAVAAIRSDEVGDPLAAILVTVKEAITWGLTESKKCNSSRDYVAHHCQYHLHPLWSPYLLVILMMLEDHNIDGEVAVVAGLLKGIHSERKDLALRRHLKRCKRRWATRGWSHCRMLSNVRPRSDNQGILDFCALMMIKVRVSYSKMYKLQVRHFSNYRSRESLLFSASKM